MYISDWQRTFVICHSAVIARKMKLLQPDRALQLCNREIGTQRLLIPHRAALRVEETWWAVGFPWLLSTVSGFVRV